MTPVFAVLLCRYSLCLAVAQLLHGRHDEAAAVFLRNCTDNDNATSCFHLGVLHASKAIKGASDELATKYFMRSCDVGGASGCLLAGLASVKALGCQQNIGVGFGEWAVLLSVFGWKTAASVWSVVFVQRHLSSPVMWSGKLTMACGLGSVTACSILGDTLLVRGRSLWLVHCLCGFSLVAVAVVSITRIQLAR